VAAIKADLKRVAAYAKKQGWPDEVHEFIRDWWDNAVGDED
jgi:hypothetical protein